MKTIPNYHPPQDYRRPTKTQEKVYVPVNDYPEINFSMIANPLTLTNCSPFFFAFLEFDQPHYNHARYSERLDPSSKWTFIHSSNYCKSNTNT